MYTTLARRVKGRVQYGCQWDTVGPDLSLETLPSPDGRQPAGTDLSRVASLSSLFPRLPLHRRRQAVSRRGVLHCDYTVTLVAVEEAGRVVSGPSG